MVRMRSICGCGMCSILILSLCLAADVTAQDSSVCITVQRFQKLDGPSRLDSLEVLLPQAFKASLFSYHWIEVSAAEPAITESTRGRCPGVAGVNNSLSLEGAFINIGEKIRLDITIRDVSSNAVLFSTFEMFTEDAMLEVVAGIGKRVATAIQIVKLDLSTQRVPVAVIVPFDNAQGLTSYSFLARALPGLLLNALAAAQIENVSFRQASIAESNGASYAQARVTGEYLVSDAGLLITAEMREATGPSFRVTARGSVSDIDKVSQTLSKRIAEVLRGRLDAKGKWRLERVSLVDAPADDYYIEGRKYEAAKDPAAILMYRKAVEKQNTFLDARFHLASLYMDLRDYEAAASEYGEILNVDPRSAQAHFGRGIACVRAGQGDEGRGEVEQALRLAPEDKTIQTDGWKALGEAWLAAGDYSKAIKAYLEARHVAGDDVGISRGLARGYVGLEEFPDAIRCLEETHARFPSDADVMIDLASMYNRWAGRQYEKGEYEKSLETYEKTISLDPPSNTVKAEAYNWVGTIRGIFLDREQDKAIKELQRAAELEPENEWHYRALGVLYINAKRYDEAIGSLNRAVHIEPNALTYRCLAEAYRQTRNFDEALASAQEAIKIQPDYAAAYAELGAAYIMMKNYQEATKALSKAVSLDPKDDWTYSLLGFLYREQRSYDDALRYYQKAAELEPNEQHYTEIAECYRLMKQFIPAVGAMKQALRLAPRSVKAYETLERIYEENDQAGKFIAYLQSVVAADPSFAWAQTRLGYAYYQQKKYTDALDALDRAVKLDPNDEWAHRLIGSIYEAKQDYPSAIEHFNSALRITPTADAYAALGNDHYRQREFANAITDLNEALELDPVYTYAYEILEKVYGDTARPQDFIHTLETAVKSHPDFAWGHEKLANIYIASDELDKAIQDLNESIRVGPTAARYASLTDCYRWKHDSAKALEIAHKAFDLHEKNPASFLPLAIVFRDQHDYKKAVDVLQQGIAVVPGSADLLAELANVQRLLLRHDIALDNCNKALALSSKNVRALSVLAQLQLDLRRWNDAVVTAKRILDIDPDSGASLLRQAYSAIGKDKEGLEILESYLQKQPRSLSLLNSVEFTYHERLFDYEKAFEISKTAHDLFPKNISMLLNFAEANLTISRFSEALDLANSALADQTISSESKLSMKLIAVSAWMFQDKTAKAFSELGDFIRYYKSIPADYERQWQYDGTKKFIKMSGGLDQRKKELLLALIDILESPETQADRKVNELEASLPTRFKELQDVASVH